MLILVPCLLLIGPPARAGSYGSPQYAGGQCTYTQEFPGNWPATSSGGYGSFNGGYGTGQPGTQGTSTCTGAITTTFAYTPAAGQTAATDPPPTDVIVVETCSANVGVSGQSYLVPPTVSGGCDNGLGLSQNPLSLPPPTGTPYYTSGSATYTSTRCEIKPGASPFTLTCSPLAKATTTYPAGDGGGGSSSISVTYSAAASAVTINPVGATRDSSGNWDIMVGQYCLPHLSISGLPSSVTVGTPTWVITGSPYSGFAIGQNQQTGNATTLTDPCTAVSPAFYWSTGDGGASPGGYTQHISVSAPISYNNGTTTTNVGTVYATLSVEVFNPNLFFPTSGGEDGANNGTPALGTVGLYLSQLAVISNSSAGNENGFLLEASVTTPVQFTGNNVGTGSYAWLQLCKLVDTAGGAGMNMTSYELDSAFPFNTVAGGGDTPGNPLSCNTSAQNPIYSLFQDNPENFWETGDTAFAFNNNYELYLMYQPPNGGLGVSYVPLCLWPWNFQASMTRPATNSNNWSPYPPGSVTSSGYQIFPAYPSWTSEYGSG